MGTDNCSILIDRLPTNVEIDGMEYALNTDFRYMMLYEMANADNNLTERDKFICGLDLLFPVIPSDIKKAADFLLFFLCGGKVNKADTDSGNHTRLYDYNYDSEYIFAAFWSQYNINLQTAKMHWWEYRALFMGLANCKFTEIMNIRSIDVRGMSDKMKAEYVKLKDRHRIPEYIPEVKDADRLMDILTKGGSIEDNYVI